MRVRARWRCCEALRRGRGRQRDQLARRRRAARDARAGRCACSSGTTGSAARSARPRSPSRASSTRSSPRGIRCSPARRRTRSCGASSRRAGVEYLNTELPTATLFPDGESRFLTTSHEENVAALGPGWERTVVRVHAERRPRLRRPRHRAVVARRRPARLKVLRRLGRRGLVEFAGNVLVDVPRLDRGDVRGRACPRALRAVGAAHRARAGRRVVRLHGAGDRRRDRARRDARAARRRRPARRRAGRDRPRRRRRVRDRAGRRADRRRVRPRDRRAGRPTARSIEATTRGARERDAAGALRRLLGAVRGRVAGGAGASGTAAERCRSTSRSRSRRAGRATSGSARTAIVHLTPGLDGVSRAVNEAERGLLPAEATIVVGQPMAVDPSRAPEGSWILWIQLQEVPSRAEGRRGRRARRRRRHLDGGAARGVRRPHPGADRRQAPNFEASILRRVDVLAGRHRGREPEHARRRHLLRLVRARPEPDLAAAARACPGIARTSTGSGTSARARIPARGSAPARARSSRRSCSAAPSCAACRSYARS